MSEVEMPSDDELFNEAVETTDDPVVTEQVEQIEPEPQLETQAKTESEIAEHKAIEEESKATGIPGWRLREINEEKRRLAEENERVKAELAELRRTSQHQRQQPVEKKEDDGIDPLLDPKGYAKQVLGEIRNEILNERREESLQIAAEKYGDEFKEAYTAAQQKVDPALRARMQSSRDPGETLIKWHRENKQRAEIGDDLNAYNQRILDKALSDPAFLAKALEAAQNGARQQPQQSNGRPRVELPPTLSSASRAQATSRANSDEGKSDFELFQEIAG
jgi:hypothetical protein